MSQRLPVIVALLTIASGAALHLAGQGGAGDLVWAVGVVVVLVPLAWSVTSALLRRDVGVDAIALVAMVGAVAVGEYLAAAVVALMLSGGNALEAYAARRARRELTGLLERAPRVAHRRRDGAIEEVAAGAVAVGDVVVVRAGDVVPVDGVVERGLAVIDTSTLTGEPLPVTVSSGDEVRSGTSNAGDAFDLRATRTAEHSAYAAIVRLVQEAERREAPFVRMADRYAVWFLPLTLLVSGAAWLLSGDPVQGVAVLVVATPCPLILAAPIALISGVSRAAHAGVIVKGSDVIERLGQTHTVLLDKTGTITMGAPDVERVIELGTLSGEETLRIAASLDQLSGHVTAKAIVHAARLRGLVLTVPSGVSEAPGRGVEGELNGHRAAVGSGPWIREIGYHNGVETEQLLAEHENGDGAVMVGVDGHVQGAILMGDHVRPGARELVTALRRVGVEHVALVSGDRRAVADRVARELGVDRAYAEQLPDQKVEIVRALRGQPALRMVVMVGDGINDAPALAVADVGIAMAAAGATVSSETADAVIVVDRVDRVAQAVAIGRRSLAIARQSVLAGMALSMVAMGFAAVGLLPPVWGAMLQEVIDVAVILNALRALRD